MSDQLGGSWLPIACGGMKREYRGDLDGMTRLSSWSWRGHYFMLFHGLRTVTSGPDFASLSAAQAACDEAAAKWLAEHEGGRNG